nr:hypothetical protein [Brachyspira hyodysenteriae]
MFSFFVDKKILDAYFDISYHTNRNDNSITYFYYYNKYITNSISMEAVYYSDSTNENNISVHLIIYPENKLDDSIEEIHFFNDDFMSTFTVSYMEGNYLLISIVNFILFDEISRLKTILMFKNGGVKMMYNFNNIVYKYNIDDKTSSMVYKIMNNYNSKFN